MDHGDAEAWRRRALAMRALANACASRIDDDRASAASRASAATRMDASTPTRVTARARVGGDGVARENVARLMRALDSRRSEERAALEGEIARLATRVRELEATARTPRRSSPRKEVLAPTSPDDWGVPFELSPSSPSEMTPDRGDGEATRSARGTGGRDARPPRPRDGTGGNEDDAWIEAHGRAAFTRGALPTHVRPGRGFVCPFTGDVVETPRSVEQAS